jgi:hypothetical protein
MYGERAFIVQAYWGTQELLGWRSGPPAATPTAYVRLKTWQKEH